MVPLIFEPYAVDIAERTAANAPQRVLEIACGTGVATRELAKRLPATSTIVATDLNPPMFRHAAAIGTARAVEWREADAMRLPFDDAGFDAVVCQFGAMFFPDRAKAFAEARRALRRGGRFIFSVWDRIEENEFADVITNRLAEMFPDAPPRFLARSPHGYHDKELIAHDVAAGGFESPANIVTIAERSRAASPEIPAIAYCEGTPLRGEIPPERLREATNAAAAAIAQRFGSGAVDGKISAHVVSVAR